MTSIFRVALLMACISAVCTNAYAQLNLMYSGSDCTNRTDVNDNHTYYINVGVQGDENCSTPTVTSLDKWTVGGDIAPATKEEVSGMNFKQIRLSWNSNVTIDVWVEVSYNCNNNSTTSNRLHFTLGPPTVQSVSLSLNTTSIVQGAPVTLTASSSGGGTSPLYNYYVNGTEVCHDCGTSYEYKQCSAPVGTIPVHVVMKGNGICRVPYDGAASNTVNLSISNKPQISAMLNPPLTICENTTSGEFHVTSTGYDGPKKYEWFKDGQTLGSSYNSDVENLTFSEGTVIRARVYSDECASPDDTDNFTVVWVDQQSPTADVQVLKNVWCDGEQMVCTPTSNHGGTSYEWFLNGSPYTTKTTNEQISIPVSISNVPGYFHPGSTVSIKISGQTGTCMTQTSATSDPRSFSVLDRPTASASSNPVCTEKQATINLVDLDGISGTSFEWTVKSRTNATGGSSGNGSSQIQHVLTNTDQINPGSVTYTIKAYNNVCYSEPIDHTVTVNPPSQSVATITKNHRFETGPFELEASGAATSEKYNWYDPANAPLITDAATYITPNVSATTSNYAYVRISSVNGCEGAKSWVTVNVYAKPVVQSTRQNVYRGLTATLSTDVYDSYDWKNESGGSLASTSSYVTGVTGKYKVIVVKNGAVGTSNFLTIYGQLDGQDLNYVVTRTPLFTGKTSFESVEQSPIGQISESIEYFDGLGRPIQSVVTQGSPGNNDIVQPVVYDQFGRNTVTYLPYTSTSADGTMKANAVSSGQPAFYDGTHPSIPGDDSPYAKTIFEPSPLNRVSEAGSPGHDWQPVTTTRAVKKNYRLNITSEVLFFRYNHSTGEISLLSGTNAHYPANKLHCNVTIDEHGNDVQEFLDMDGKVVCKKVRASSTELACTYYVYDDFGNLVAVIPPEGVKKITGGN